MKRPPNIKYWLEDKPPFVVTFLSGLQHISIVCSFLPIPIAVASEAGLGPGGMMDLISVSMLVLGVTAIIQAQTRGPVGSGLLAPSCFSGAYLSPSLLALKTGGLPLVFGMTMFGGVIETGVSRLLRFLRPFLPPEIAGFVVMMVGLAVGGLGVRYAIGVGAAVPMTARELAVSAVTLSLLVGLNVWGRGALRLFCALLGLIGGYVACALLGILNVTDFAHLMAIPLVGVPGIAKLGWSFNAAFMIPFAVAAVAASLKNVGDLTTCQRINDGDWVRPDMLSISRGTLANAIGSIVSGFLGTTGLNTSSANIGLAGATGATSRRIAYTTGVIFIVLAFMPKVSALFAIMPRPVMGALLIFVAAFILVNGLQIIASRVLDLRRTFVIGLSFIVAISVDISPTFFHGLPASLQPLVGSSIVAGMLTAIFLNLIFRIGVRKVETLVLPIGRVDTDEIHHFMDGLSWGARRDIMDRARFNCIQSIEVIMDSCAPQSPIEIAASFDEFNLDLQVSYAGWPLELPENRPTNEEILESDAGQRRLAGFLLRSFADRVQASHRLGRSVILFHFDH
jgi:xanthine permease XanP